MKKNKFLKIGFLLLAIVFASSCEESPENLTPPVAVGFDVDSDSVEVLEDTSYDLVVQTASVSNTDTTVFLTLDEANTTADADMFVSDITSLSVTIPAGQLKGSVTIDFNYSVLEFGDSRTLAFELDSEDITLNTSRTEFELDFVKFCTLNNVELAIETDDYPEETAYELYQLVNGSPVLLKGNSYGAYAGMTNTTVTEKFCLGSGSYAIVIYDAYLDGIESSGYTLSVNGEVVESGPVTGEFVVGYFDIE